MGPWIDNFKSYQLKICRSKCDLLILRAVSLAYLFFQEYSIFEHIVSSQHICSSDNGANTHNLRLKKYKQVSLGKI